MKNVARCALVLTLVLLTSALWASDGMAVKTMTGEYLWNRQDGPGPIKAEFVATDDNQWNVSFYFNFRDVDHVYSGTATGSLSHGELRGEVMSDGERPQPFVFEGTVESGTFTGTHRTEGEDGEETGTLTLHP